MAFDQQLRAYLEGLEPRVAAGPPAVRRRIDEHELRAHFLARLRELEHRSTLVEGLFLDWSPRLVRFARYLEQLPATSAPVEDDRALAFARRALDCALDVDPAIPLVERLELQRIIDGFERGDGSIETYALENRLVRREASGGARLTGLGRIFLRLRGKDAVRWLLTAEVLQSRGDDDPWRCSRTLLADALEAGIDRAPLEEQELLPYAIRTLERLTDLGVLDGRADDAGEVSRYDLQGSMRDVAQAVLDGGPWQSAVAALVDDERAVIFQGPGPTASDATIEQTRMIAHEVRNALVPVRHHIDALLATPAEVPASGRIEAARRGVVRVLTFVDEMVATSELVDEPARSCELADVVSEALGWIDGGERIEVGGAGKGIQLRVPRTRLARAISNLLLNALQATTASQRVRVSVAETDAAVEIIVDDAGAGVPRTQRRRVFDDGFTMRAGGSGYGLAFVRSVVERELHGEVWCDASELGGARFVITIPKVVEQ